jgi:hypothetical protein
MSACNRDREVFMVCSSLKALKSQLIEAESESPVYRIDSYRRTVLEDLRFKLGESKVKCQGDYGLHDGDGIVCQADKVHAELRTECGLSDEWQIST